MKESKLNSVNSNVIACHENVSPRMFVVYSEICINTIVEPLFGYLKMNVIKLNGIQCYREFVSFHRQSLLLLLSFGITVQRQIVLCHFRMPCTIWLFALDSRSMRASPFTFVWPFVQAVDKWCITSRWHVQTFELNNKTDGSERIAHRCLVFGVWGEKAGSDWEFLVEFPHSSDYGFVLRMESFDQHSWQIGTLSEELQNWITIHFTESVFRRFNVSAYNWIGSCYSICSKPLERPMGRSIHFDTIFILLLHSWMGFMWINPLQRCECGSIKRDCWCRWLF